MTGFGRRHFTTGAGAAAIVAGSGGHANAQGEQVVRICSFGGSYQDMEREVLFKPFERATGIKVLESTGPGIARVRAMVTAGNVEWDVIETDPGEFLTMSAANYLEPVDYQLLGKDLLDKVDPALYRKSGFPALYYSQVLAWNTESFRSKPPQSWADMWDVKGFPGRRILPSGAYQTRPYEVALLADGVDPKTLYPLDIDRAFRSLDRIRPHVAQWATSAATAPQALASGEADMAAATYARVAALKAQGAPVDFTWNQGIVATEYWAIPRGAKNLANAHRFIAFAAAPQQMANISKAMPLGPINNDAFSLLTEKERQMVPSYPANLARQVALQPEWWAAKDAVGRTNIEAVLERWNKWVVL